MGHDAKRAYIGSFPTAGVVERAVIALFTGPLIGLRKVYSYNHLHRFDAGLADSSNKLVISFVAVGNAARHKLIYVHY
eukprot:XP_001707897.1 Hypothetical protein GL50803_31757 [Giardia lamblia ATCC 50803]